MDSSRPRRDSIKSRCRPDWREEARSFPYPNPISAGESARMVYFIGGEKKVVELSRKHSLKATEATHFKGSSDEDEPGARSGLRPGAPSSLMDAGARAHPLGVWDVHECLGTLGGSSK
uniref:Uncharacterized protein n=1 Tax=Oryza punctata TaxID=4537 RepID=A0A0E0KET4_ORYPU